MRAVLPLLWLVLGALLWAPALPAQPERRAKVVLFDPHSPALASRLREEFESLGLEVELVPALLEGESAEARAREAGAVAAIRLTDVGTRAVEMTIVDRTTGKTVSRRLALSTPDDPAAAELVATRTVELLRASLMELSAPHPARGDVGMTKEIEALAPPAAPAAPGSRLSLGLGPALIYSPDFRPGAHALAVITFRPRSAFGVTFALLLPVTAARLSSAEGDVELFASELRLGATLDLLRAASSWGLRFQAGLLLARLSLSGEASAPFFGAQEQALAAGPWLGAAGRLRLASNLSAFVDVTAALTYPRTVIRAAGRELTTWGRPVGSAALGLELTWP